MGIHGQVLHRTPLPTQDARRRFAPTEKLFIHRRLRPFLIDSRSPLVPAQILLAHPWGATSFRISSPASVFPSRPKIKLHRQSGNVVRDTFPLHRDIFPWLRSPGNVFSNPGNVSRNPGSTFCNTGNAYRAAGNVFPHPGKRKSRQGETCFFTREIVFFRPGNVARVIIPCTSTRETMHSVAGSMHRVAGS